MKLEYIIWDSFFDELEKNAFMFDELQKEAFIREILGKGRRFQWKSFKELAENIPKGVKPLAPHKKIKKSQVLYAAGLK